MACLRLAPADTVSGMRVSVGTEEDGRGGKAVNVKGESGECGNGWMCAAVGVVVLAGGFSFACRGKAEARACALGARVGFGGDVVVVGGMGGVEGRAVMDCDNFDGGSDPYGRRRNLVKA